jgi:hypothetical protein
VPDKCPYGKLASATQSLGRNNFLVSWERSTGQTVSNLGPIWVHNLPNTVHYRAVRCKTELDESST